MSALERGDARRAASMAPADGPEKRGRAPTAQPPGYAVTAVSWTPQTELGLREWLEHGRRLGALGRGVSWWIGDWLLYGNLRHGERYARASRATGYDRQSLMNMAYVASRFEVGRRRAALSWTHHAEVAALPVDEQEHWLTRAEDDRMSVRSLRTEVRAIRRRRADPAMLQRSVEEKAVVAASVVCPHCQGVIDLAGEHPRVPLPIAAATPPQ
jgi:hypothetical protein